MLGWDSSQYTYTHVHSSCVRVVSSTRSGMGKSLFITRMADRLRKSKSTGPVHVIVPIHGPVVTTDTVMEFLKDHMKDVTSTIFHFDIAPSVSVWQLCVQTLLPVWVFGSCVLFSVWICVPIWLVENSTSLWSVFYLGLGIYCSCMHIFIHVMKTKGERCEYETYPCARSCDSICEIELGCHQNYTKTALHVLPLISIASC